jgi:hypothetical protein
VSRKTLDNTFRRRAAIILVNNFQFNKQKSNGVEQGGQMDSRDCGQEGDNAIAKGLRDKERRPVPDLVSRDRDVVLVRRIFSSGKPQGVGNLE